MRIQGRTLRPSSLSERRVLKSLGVDAIRVPRRLNPFAIARHVKKLAAGVGGDMPALRAMLKPRAPVPSSADLPDSTSAPRANGDGAA